jgi:2-amino-4-hydroxy-6-hydroxymethyldihydropteridine diphosphokinase
MTNDEVSNGSSIAVYVGLGSNVGDRLANLHDANERIRKLNLDITRVSSVYETEPVGYVGQPWFLNQVLEASIRNSSSEAQPVIQAERLLFDLLEIENAMGRARTFENGPRVIDLDLLLFGEVIIRDTGRRIAVPHPRMHERRFVLEPLCEIAPNLLHPALKKTCRELLAQIDDHYRVRLFEKAFLNPTSR